jgi:sirohydrochlorin ferrochelatase
VVGDPKNLADLRRIEAQVRVTCRGCKASELWELEALIAEVRNNGGSTEWRSARAAVRCPQRCASPLIDLLPIPFGQKRARRRAYRHALINLALEILRDAAGRSSTEAVGTLEVRLALHVLRPFMRESKLLADFWSAATVQPRHPWTSCHLPYRRIVQRLVERGAPVDEANRP